jgi:hypothetical protein
MILSQLVDADELTSLSPEELRNMLSRLDDDVVYGSSEALLGDSEAAEAGAAEAGAAGDKPAEARADEAQSAQVSSAEGRS